MSKQILFGEGDKLGYIFQCNVSLKITSMGEGVGLEPHTYPPHCHFIPQNLLSPITIFKGPKPSKRVIIPYPYCC